MAGVTLESHTTYNQTSSSFWNGNWGNVPFALLILILISATITVLLLMLTLYCLFFCLWKKYYRPKPKNDILTSRRSFLFTESLSQTRSIGSGGKKRKNVNNPTAIPTNWADVEIMLKMPNDAMRQLKREQTPIMRMVQLTRANRRQLINLGYSDAELESIGYYRSDTLNKNRKQIPDWYATVTDNSQSESLSLKPMIRTDQSEQEVTFKSTEFESGRSNRDKRGRMLPNKYK
ncbi:uncharacterized protein LOC113791698 [Dermatophagoides pteronyssinus]|uniref:Uncharacterized protein n=2 Tax=Dermatophagoides pteronyssinus TaxID=6956 RepID=A0ABQ8JHR6_DERPT|nr:uncharacterized protein LOC113791698 [Dermatophagoides pteronyssinus]KAH9421977.1 hypothetical protein DERP_002267 [Dermatophagoides pteronyssinus]